ncbi:IS4 family transposase [Salmonella enterica]|nr:IS4 family transposase [Salmonella enterica]
MGRVTPVPAQPFFHFRRITLNPAVNRGVIDIHSAFSQHLLQLTVTDAVFAVPAYGPQNDVTLKMPAFEWVHVQLHQQKGMISLSPPTICNSALPSNTTPLIVSDAGFKVPWYKSVEKLGWYWLSRVRGKVQYADLGAENWKPISNLHDMSSSHSKTLGYKRLTKSNPISCQILLYKSRSKGRKNQRSTRTHCHHPSPKIYSASAKEPWVLATNLPVEIRTPKQLVNIYSKRMQIEETFRDLKSPAYGLGLRHSRTSSSERFDIMLLIALMLQLTCWLAGVHAQKQGWDKHFQANTVRNRNVLSTVRLGMEVLRHSGYTITREDLLVAATLLAQNLFTHGYALGKL